MATDAILNSETGKTGRQFSTFFVADLFFRRRRSARPGSVALSADDAGSPGARR